MQAVHDRHLHIHQHQVPLRGWKQVHRNLSVFCQRHGVTPFLQQGGDQKLVDGMILRQQYVQGTRGAGRRSNGYRRRRSERSLSRSQLQGEVKGAALAWHTVNPELPTHQFHQACADGQPQACAPELAGDGRVGLGES